MILKVLGNEHVGHSQEQGGIRTWLNLNPLISKPAPRGIELRINTDDLGALLFGLGEVESRIRAKARNQGIPAPKDDQFGIKEIIAGIAGKKGAKRGHRRKKSRFLGGISKDTCAAPKERKKAPGRSSVSAMEGTLGTRVVHK